MAHPKPRSTLELPVSPIYPTFVSRADKEELSAKIQQLDARLNDKKEQLLEKELILEEVTSLSDKLRAQVSHVAAVEKHMGGFVGSITGMWAAW